MTARGATVDRDAFGHVRLDTINPGKWFAEQFAKLIGAEKTLVQKSGYFARSAPANAEDFQLIDTCVLKAVECARAGVTGLIGHDEERGNELRAIEFPPDQGRQGLRHHAVLVPGTAQGNRPADDQGRARGALSRASGTLAAETQFTSIRV
ncbi:MAG: hypothetical protein WDM96_19540 [Lacunisphaera sp.]